MGLFEGSNSNWDWQDQRKVYDENIDGKPTRKSKSNVWMRTVSSSESICRDPYFDRHVPVVAARIFKGICLQSGQRTQNWIWKSEASCNLLWDV